MAQADGSVIIDTKINDDGLMQGFERLKTDAESLGVTCEKAGDKIKMAFADYDVSANIQNAVYKLQEAQNKLQVATDNFKDAIAMDNDKSAMAWAAKREAAYARVEAAQRRLTQVIAAEAEKQAAAEESAQEKATRATEREAAKKKKAQEKAYNDATKGARKFGNRLSRILSGALIFNILSSGLSKLTSYFGKMLKKNSEFSESFAKLKGAFLTAIQPIYETVVPILTTLIQLFTQVTLAVGKLFSALSGKSISQSRANAKALYEQADATEAVGTAAKNAKKYLAGFDELNTMQSNDSAGSGSNATTGENPDFSAIELNSTLEELISYTPAVLIALGAILALSGANIPLGIGMVAAGALMLYSMATTNLGAISSNVWSVVDTIISIGGALVLTLGIILVCCCPSKLGLGIGMIVAGAALLATAVALNWNSIASALQTSLGATIALIVGGVLLAIGVLLCVAQNWPLGIALIAAGAASIWATIAANWGSIKQKVSEVVNAVVNWVKTYGMLVIGILMCFTGVGLPIGLYVIYKWAKTNAGSIPLANKILSTVQSVWRSIKEFWNMHIAKIFTKKFWLNLAKKCGNGLIEGFENAINGIISIYEKLINYVVSGLNKISFNVPDWVPNIGGKKFGFNIPKVSFGRVSIPRLAQGSVIPPNKEFLAVLGDQKHGTNIEAPLTTIQEAVALVMEDMTGGMMAGFEALLEENQRLRAAVEGIEVGDSTIGQAANRYNQRMAMIRG